LNFLLHESDKPKILYSYNVIIKIPISSLRASKKSICHSTSRSTSSRPWARSKGSRSWVKPKGAVALHLLSLWRTGKVRFIPKDSRALHLELFAVLYDRW